MLTEFQTNPSDRIGDGDFERRFIHRPHLLVGASLRVLLQIFLADSLPSLYDIQARYLYGKDHIFAILLLELLEVFL